MIIIEKKSLQIKNGPANSQLFWGNLEKINKSIPKGKLTIITQMLGGRGDVAAAQTIIDYLKETTTFEILWVILNPERLDLAVMQLHPHLAYPDINAFLGSLDQNNDLLKEIFSSAGVLVCPSLVFLNQGNEKVKQFFEVFEHTYIPLFYITEYSSEENKSSTRFIHVEGIMFHVLYTGPGQFEKGMAIRLPKAHEIIPLEHITPLSSKQFKNIPFCFGYLAKEENPVNPNSFVWENLKLRKILSTNPTSDFMIIINHDFSYDEMKKTHLPALIKDMGYSQLIIIHQNGAEYRYPINKHLANQSRLIIYNLFPISMAEVLSLMWHAEGAIGCTGDKSLDQALICAVMRGNRLIRYQQVSHKKTFFKRLINLAIEQEKAVFAFYANFSLLNYDNPQSHLETWLLHQDFLPLLFQQTREFAQFIANNKNLLFGLKNWMISTIQHHEKQKMLSGFLSCNNP